MVPPVKFPDSIDGFEMFGFLTPSIVKVLPTPWIIGLVANSFTLIYII